MRPEEMKSQRRAIDRILAIGEVIERRVVFGGERAVQR
jgi:hypothetical protein